MSTTIWTMVVLALVSCAAPASPTPTPAPTVAIPASHVVATAAPTRLAEATLTVQPTVALSTPMPVPSPVLTATSVPSATPTVTPVPRAFDDVDTRTLLTALFPELKLTADGDEWVVNDNPGWHMWINSRIEGRLTQDTLPELAVVVANEAPHVPEAELSRIAPWGSFLAIFQKRNGKLEVAQRSMLFPTAISPAAFSVNMESVPDYDHDGRNELLITTTSMRQGLLSRAAFLYEWDGQAFAELWSANVGEDNTGAINQSGYHASTSNIRLADLDGNGIDEIIVETTWIDYDRDAQGLANLDKEIGRHVDRHVYRWEGATFVEN